jgi:hypothetical protein
MQVRIGLENNNEGRSIAWALDHFGCIGYGADGQTALMAMAAAIPNYIEWLEKHTANPWFNPENIDIRLVEVVEDYFIDKEYIPIPEGKKLIKAWFKSDWKPLSQLEVEHALQILSWSRVDLLDLITPLSDEQLDRRYDSEIWSIREIAAHLAKAEWWLLDRLNRAHDVSLIPDDAFERLVHERGWLVNTLPDLIDEQQVIGKEGEIWSPRKVVRRLCWHERDHIQHIQKLLAR